MIEALANPVQRTRERESALSARNSARFEAGELAVALSHYDLGVIESVTDFPRGSRRSPKVGIVAERGKFLLKRRSLDRIQPDRLRLSHQVQTYLAGHGFPAPKLVPTRNRGSAWLQIREHVYELFEFVAGEPFRRTPEEARQAGLWLARFHGITESFESPLLAAAPRGDFHDAPGIRTGLYSIGHRLQSHESFMGHEAELPGLVDALLAAYDRAAEHANRAGLGALPERLIHGDWHPGNLVFRDGRVIGVIDYDAMRLSRRAMDIANGALQFSILAGGDPAEWPDALDLERFRAFLDGYAEEQSPAETERTCLVDLMIEALIGECVPQITRTGSLGGWSGFRVLKMVKRKVDWMQHHADRLA